MSGQQAVGVESALGAGTTLALRGARARLRHTAGIGGRSGCLLTSSFMGMLASAFLSAESGRKAGQSAGGVQLRDREEGQREGRSGDRGRDGGREENQRLRREGNHHTKQQFQYKTIIT